MTPDINKILAGPENEACSKYGAEMGRRSQKEGEPERLHLQRMRYVDGDYDTGGAYWGGPIPSDRNPTSIYCAFSPENTENTVPIRVFVRAANRAGARVAVLKRLGGKGWSFYR